MSVFRMDGTSVSHPPPKLLMSLPTVHVGTHTHRERGRERKKSHVQFQSEIENFVYRCSGTGGVSHLHHKRLDSIDDNMIFTQRTHTIGKSRGRPEGVVCCLVLPRPRVCVYIARNVRVKTRHPEEHSQFHALGDAQ